MRGMSTPLLALVLVACSASQGIVSLEPASVEVSLGSGADASLNLSASQGALYLALAGVSGTSPGTLLPDGQTLPLNLDPLALAILSGTNQRVGQLFQGFGLNYVYDPNGQQGLTIHLPNVPRLIGLTIYVAAAVSDLSGVHVVGPSTVHVNP